MSVIETRYRDITCEELRRLHSEMDFEAFADEEWQRMRNRLIQVALPPLSEDQMDQAQKTCGERWYRVVGGALTNDREWNVCSHLAEIGD